jgi:hypothetical protein
VHDLADYEGRGVATVMVASSEFMQAARSQAEALGLPELADCAVYVPHPIQDASDEEMRAKARAAVNAIVQALTDPAAKP